MTLHKNINSPENFNNQKQLIEILENQILHLENIVKETINLPKGVEPHSWSDYKIKKNAT